MNNDVDRIIAEEKGLSAWMGDLEERVCAMEECMNFADGKEEAPVPVRDTETEAHATIVRETEHVARLCRRISRVTGAIRAIYHSL